MGALATHNLVSQGGAPHREIEGSIRFDGDNSTFWFLDPTPYADEEYLTLIKTDVDLGGGTMNIGRIHTNAFGAAAGAVDLLSVAKHEIGPRPRPELRQYGLSGRDDRRRHRRDRAAGIRRVDDPIVGRAPHIWPAR